MPTIFEDRLGVIPQDAMHQSDNFVHLRPRSLDDAARRTPVFRSSHSLPATLASRRPSGDPRLPSFGHIPGHEVIETTARILGVVRVVNHCEFRLQVETGRDQFTLQKRYSDFRELKQQLSVSTGLECRNGACIQLAQQLGTLKFPRRTLSIKIQRENGVRTARKRQVQLQHFVDLVLAVYRNAPKRQVRCCVNSKCRVLQAVRSFLEITDEDSDDMSVASFESRACRDVVKFDTPQSTACEYSVLHKPISDGVEQENVKLVLQPNH